MSVTESDRLHSQLSRLEDMFPGYKIEIVGGSIVMSPVRPFHGRSIRMVENALEEQLDQGWSTVSDVAFPFTGDDELCPDIAVIPAAECARNLSSYSPELIEIVIEIVSPSSVHNDYEVKNRLYAQQGIPHYLIFDPYRAQCTVLWHPDAEGYLGRDVLPYGKPVTAHTDVGALSLETATLPIDPGEQPFRKR